jgi:Domain of unknown function (DUF4399)
MRSIALLTMGLLLAGSLYAADGPMRPKAPSGSKVYIVSPKDGDTVGQDVTVKFGVDGIAVAPAANPTPNSGHHHLLIDVDGLPAGDAPIPNDATHKHYGKGQTEDTVHLTPGNHTLQLDFADATHLQFDPPLVSKKITVHVK